MNWLDPPDEPPNTAPPKDPEAPSESNLNYWAARLTPLHDPAPGYISAPASSEDQDPFDGVGREVVFVSCNRVGTEEGALLPTLGLPCSRSTDCDGLREMRGNS